MVSANWLRFTVESAATEYIMFGSACPSSVDSRAEIGCCTVSGVRLTLEDGATRVVIKNGGPRS